MFKKNLTKIENNENLPLGEKNCNEVPKFVHINFNI